MSNNNWVFFSNFKNILLTGKQAYKPSCPMDGCDLIPNNTIQYADIYHYGNNPVNTLFTEPIDEIDSYFCHPNNGTVEAYLISQNPVRSTVLYNSVPFSSVYEAQSTKYHLFSSRAIEGYPCGMPQDYVSPVTDGDGSGHVDDPPINTEPPTPPIEEPPSSSSSSNNNNSCGINRLFSCSYYPQ